MISLDIRRVRGYHAGGRRDEAEGRVSHGHRGRWSRISDMAAYLYTLRGLMAVALVLSATACASTAGRTFGPAQASQTAAKPVAPVASVSDITSPDVLPKSTAPAPSTTTVASDPTAAKIDHTLSDPRPRWSMTSAADTKPSAAVSSPTASESNDADVSDPDSSDDSSDDAETDSTITYDVPVVKNESVDGYIEYFQVTIRERFEKWLSRSSRYLPTMTKIFRDQGLPEDLVFVALIESGFNPYAYSRAKASGTWQFIRSTGKRYGLTINDWVDERRDPIKSTVAAASYLKDLYGMFGSWPLALASYNAGEGKIQKAIRRTKSDDFWDIKNTRYIRAETKNYVPKFMAATIIAKDPERYGFSLPSHGPLEFDEVEVSRPMTLAAMASAMGVDPQEMKELNPELRRGVTPPYSKGYVVRLPAGTRDRLLASLDQIPTYKGPLYTRHTVQRGQTLLSIARHYGTTVSELKTVNHLRSSRLRVGMRLRVPTTTVESDSGPSRGSSVSKVSYTTSSPASPKQTVYRVKRGDTLSSIAKNFNISMQDLLSWNQSYRNGLIHPGDRIVLFTNIEES